MKIIIIIIYIIVYYKTKKNTTLVYFWVLKVLLCIGLLFIDNFIFIIIK